MKGLVLGSTSRYRRSLLERLRLPFTTAAPEVDEDSVKRGNHTPLTLAQDLARKKAEAVFARHPEAVVIGSDQTACVGSKVYDKPGSIDNAIAQLRELRGKEHLLITAVAIAYRGGLVEFKDTTRMLMRDLSEHEIARYVRNDEPIHCAGSYKIEGLGISLFERIDGQDHTAIMGLPLMRLSRELRQIGVPLP